MKPCAKPIELEKLTAWWLGELEDEALEAHVMGCAHCARRGEALAATATGIRAAVRSGAVGISPTQRFLDYLIGEGMRIREYPAAPGETVRCTITAQDDAVMSRLKAPLAGVKRVDALRTLTLGGQTEHMRAEDVPFDAAAGEVLFIPPATHLKKMPAHTWHVQLVAVDDAGERELAEYTFDHTPS